MRPKAGELFAGYGGLALAVEAAFNAETAWVAEWEEAPAKILEANWPEAPNLRDVTTVDWSKVEAVQIISGGSPCQDVSAAGARAGMADGTRSNLWSAMRESIATIRPEYVVWENVAGVRSAKATSRMESRGGRVGDAGGPALRALGRVLGDLSSLGYDAQWRTVRASDVGAIHQRARVFVLAHRADTIRYRQERREIASQGMASDSSDYTLRLGASRRSRCDAGQGVPEASASWGRYEPLMTQWARVVGRPAPWCAVDGPRGGRVLNPKFTEWMMGLPEGWVTSHGLARAEELKATGNGVVPQQAYAAICGMLANIEPKEREDNA